MDDVLIAGGGPAGALAALLLARAGVGVRVFERAAFPRDKLCGDTVNPGAVAILSRHLDVSTFLDRSLPVTGMRISGPGGVSVEARYAGDQTGRAITRRVFDEWLLSQAAAAGARIDDGVRVSDPIVGPDGRVAGVRIRGVNNAPHDQFARLTIAADGRRSRLASTLGLTVAPRWPRRWAIGGYFDGVRELRDGGEMHVRAGHYIGVAPVPGGLTNACLVEPLQSGASGWSDPSARLQAALAGDAMLAPRFAGARLVSPAVMLGPMATDASRAGMPGLLLAGDAAGFIDPITGDGIRFALRGAELAARVALDVLEGRLPIDAAAAALDRERRQAFAAKWRFNRALRRLVASPRGLAAAAVLARLAPIVFADVIRYAGDTDAEAHPSPAII